MKKKTDLTKKIMKEIRQKKVKMRPKIYFVLGSAFLGVGMAGLVILTIFFVNLILFRLRTHKPFLFLMFGRLGMRAFLLHFPWLPLIAAIGGLFLGFKLLKHYDFSYKKSFWGLVISLIVLVITLGFALDRIGVNEKAKGMKHLRPFYRNQFSEKEKQNLKKKMIEWRRKNPKNKRKIPPFLYE